MKVSRVLSAIIALGYVALSVWISGGMTRYTLGVALVVLIPLAFIWFPERIGQAKNYRINRQAVDQPSPPILISVAGWFFLVVVPLVFYWMSRPAS